MIVLAALCLGLTAAPLFPQSAPAFTVRNAKPGGNFLWGIASGPTGLVAVGDGGTILTSANGTTWTRRNSGVTDWLGAVAYGAGQYLAVGDRGRVLSSADGASWASVSHSATTARLNNVLYAGGLFVAVGEAGTIITSPDARNWTARSSGTTSWLRGLTHLSPGITYPRIPDGQIVSLNSGFWACGQNGLLLRSSDGETWTGSVPGPGSSVPARDLEALAAFKDYNNENTRSFAAIGADGTYIWEQYQINFSKLPGPTGARVASPAYILNGFSRIDPTVRLRGLAIAANVLFATGEGGTILTSSGGGSPWTHLASGTTANLVAGVFAGNSLFVVGENETVLQSAPLYHSRLLNISTRGRVGTGDDALIAGMIVRGPTAKQMLIRAAGPALAAFGVSGALASPVLTVLDASGRTVATNTNWSAAPNASALATTGVLVGAFPFATNRTDAAVLLTLDPGAYTLRVNGTGDSTGVALVECYDADGLSSDGSRAINISTRGSVGSEGNTLIAGFSVGGASSRRVLVRAVGPTLRSFGVNNVLAAPRIDLFASTGVEPHFVAVSSWSLSTNVDELRGAALLAGAFALTEDSADAAFIATLAPGNYTAVVSGRNSSTGIALVEVYDLP